MKYIKNLVAGYKEFSNKEIKDGQYRYSDLSEGQSPKVMVISCSDSRVIPSQIFNMNPGDLFMVRNVANLVPPCETDETHHGTSSALEFAVLHLNVEHIVVMGHSSCGGIKACRCHKKSSTQHSFITKWISILDETTKKVLEQHANANEQEQQHALELEAIKTSLKNLETFPFIADRLKNGTLAIHGAHFDIENGQLYALNAENDLFESV